MANAQLAPVLRHIGRMVDPQATKDLTDAELLERYTAQHDEAAFTTILHRYGRLVLARCRRVLHHEQNAEDAFQATFLILARKAASIRKRDALASWLYRVASHIAMKAKKEASRRRNHERGALGVPKDNPHSDLALQELQEVLDEELQRLPETYRLPFVLCCLNGQSKTEAARHLGWKEGTVSGRLARARKLLQQRLSTRGVALSAGLAAAALSQSATGAGVPAALTADTIQAALLYGAGKTVPAGLLSRTVIGLLHGVTSTMFVSKCKLATALLLAIGFFATGAGMLMHAVPVAITLVEGEEQPGQEATQAPAKAESQQPARADRQGDALPPGAVVRLGTLRFRHDSWVESVAVSSEGKLIAGGGAGRVRLWDGATGKELRWFDLPRGVATPVALSPDGKLLATGGGDHVIRLWDPASGNLLHELIGHEALPVDPLVGRPIGILKIAFAPGGKTLASLGADRTIRLWESATARQLHQLKAPTGDIPFGMSLAFSPDGKALAAGGERVGKPNLLVVWDAGTGKELRRWKPPSAVLSLAWSPDGKILATAASDPKNKAGITLWDAATGLKLRCLTGQENPVSVRFSSDGKTVASAGGYPDSTLRLWDAASGRAIRQISTTAAGNFGIDFLDGVLAAPRG
ncbi:MAG: sigma-70 family RNA polymerase sigma factor [Planctomycetes bacterium]|nr:sigma-70 family RNA polymerase sigma factor [Planctomycetota bacterium]